MVSVTSTQRQAKGPRCSEVPLGQLVICLIKGENMSFAEELGNTWKEEEAFMQRNANKCGDYENPENGCPNCGRFRVMLGDDKKHRCEKCCWCIEDADYDLELLEYSR